jgi:hypothetical protein
MPVRKVYLVLLSIQSFYTLVTALWAIIDIHSFMMVTGPKTDIWLVKTVSVLLLAIASVFIYGLLKVSDPLPVIILAITSSAGLAVVDFYYTSSGTIKWVYSIDGILQVIFIVIWLILLFQRRKIVPVPL